ncbi:hypothetical protein J2Z32_000091 [Paenibacillus turicensis]|uniref:Heparinase n=1 Tax=Paenibacillus turicensis TaxID=160487 RepID=A0ABS4FM62_9BACL|nr:heparinase II/III family protein [Paenibacillus turicensis]MBP1903479.1 hypothetical protein [Paenibacillus turicensis]
MESEQLMQILEQVSTLSTQDSLFPGGDPEQSRQRVLASEALEPMRKDMQTQAEYFCTNQSIPELTYSLITLFAETGDRQSYDKIYFERRKRLMTLAIATWLFPEQEGYKTRLCDIIFSICNEYTWCLPAHLTNQTEKPMPTIDLFAAETAFALAEILRLHEEWLPSLICKRIQDEVFTRVLNSFIDGSRYFDWEQATHNWSSVCGGSVGIAALYLLENEPAKLTVVLERVLPALEYFLSGYHDDGVCMEGYGYWEYGFGYYVYFADLLKQRTLGKIDLLKCDKVKQIATFQQKAFLDGRNVVNFSDALANSGVFMGLGHYLHSNVDGVDLPPLELMKSFTEDHCGRWGPAIRNLVWFEENLYTTTLQSQDQNKVKGSTWAAGDYWLPDAQWLISRHVNSQESYVFAAKGGHNDEPHNHNDVGHFILYGEGQTWLADLGSGLYSADYFGEQRYQIPCNASFGHSVPIINGRYQSAGAKHGATVTNLQLGERTNELELELASAYEGVHLQSLRRCFKWYKTPKSEKPYLELTDKYCFTDMPEQVTERFICAVKPELVDGNVEMKTEDLTIRVTYAKDTLKPVINELEHIDHFGEKQIFYTLDFKSISIDLCMETKLVFAFAPLR